MPSHPIDFTIQANIYSTPELAAVFDERSRLARWLVVEAALAEAQGQLGIIPAAAAAAITTAACLDNLDLERLRQGYEESRNSLLPLIKALKSACPQPWGEFVHFGATTQDIIDTGFILEIRAGLRIVYRELRHLEEILARLAATHRKTPMIGRTHGQQALPITFGFKAAMWCREIRRHIERLKHLAPRLFMGQLGGAVGTMAALGDQAVEVARLVMRRLGLHRSGLPWHTCRDNIAETASVMTFIAATCEKIAGEIYHLGKTEIGELREQARAGQMASSAMPHKSNPVFTQRVCVLGRQVRALNALAVEAMIHEHERDPRALWSEWLAMPQIIIYSGTAVSLLAQVVNTIEVDTVRMSSNLARHPELILSEWLVYRLAGAMGKMAAQEKVHQLISRSQEEKRPLRELLRDDEQASAILDVDDFIFLLHPENYIGQSVSLTTTALDHIEKERLQDPKSL